MTSLKRVTKGIDGLSGAQKDSLKQIEATYRASLKIYGNQAKGLFEDARAAGGPPEMDEIQKLETSARSVRDDELQVARAVLTTDEQRARFDANVAALQEEEANRAADMQERRERGGGRGGPPPAAA